MADLETSNAARSTDTGSKLATLGQVKNVLDYSKNEITELKENLANMSLGYDTDGKVYIFVNGKPVGNGIQMGEAAKVYSVTNSLKDATNSNNYEIVEENSEYTALIVANEGYVLTNVIVTMGGVDITDSVYTDGAIVIPEVTGNIEIIVETEKEVVPTDIMSQFKYLGATTYSPGTYTAWCPTGLIYDEQRDVYAHFMNVRGSHSNPNDQIELWFNTINPDTLVHSEPVYVADGATGVQSGGCFLGCCVKDGKYYTFGDETRGYNVSDDGGVTWVHYDYDTAPVSNPWGCYVLSNGRMIMGTDAGAKVNYCLVSDDNGANWTKVEANAIDSSYGAFDEPTFIEFANGVLMAIIRKEIVTSDPMARPYMRVSNDYGSTWSDAVEMQTVGFMNANNCNAYVHDNYVELFVGCRIPTTNSDYEGTLYSINQYVLDRNKGAVDEFEFVNTVYEYKQDTSYEDYDIGPVTNADDFSTPVIAIKNKSQALLMFYAPTRIGVTHNLIAVGNIPVDDYEIPSIIPTSFKASQIFTGSAGETVDICDSYITDTLSINGKTYPKIRTGYLIVDDIEDGGFIHIGRISNGFGDSSGTAWWVIPICNVVDGKVLSGATHTGIGGSPAKENPPSFNYANRGESQRLETILARGEVLHQYAFIKNGCWWLNDLGTWYRSYKGNYDFSDCTYKYTDHFYMAPNQLEQRTTYKAIGGSDNFSGLTVFEYDKANS